MKRHLAEDINKRNKIINEEVKKSRNKVSDVGNKLLSDHDLSLQNVEQLGQLLAEKHKYDKQQLIVCNLSELDRKLDSHKNDDFYEKPIFIISNNDNNSKITFCIAKLSDAVVCLYKDFSNVNISRNIKGILEQYFGENIEFKISADIQNDGDIKNLDILCLKTLETMMVHLKADKKDNFIKSFANPKNPFFRWFEKGAAYLKDEIFSLIKEGYYATIASDLDQLSRDTDFKKAIKKLINDIPLIEEVNSFKNYHALLKEFVELDEDGVDFDSLRIKQLQTKIEEARKIAFSNVKELKFDMSEAKNSAPLLNIQEKFPTQIEKFRKMFETLTRAKRDDNLEQVLKEISSKLDLDYEKLKTFFENTDDTKQDSNCTPHVQNIENVIKNLPKLQSKSTDPEVHKTFEKLLSEVTVKKSQTLSIESLREGYIKVKDFHKKWNDKDAFQINQWAVSKQGHLHDSEAYEAIAVLDRANELMTGGHRLRDTQIVSILTFLQQQGKGQLSQIQTGEGKTTIVSILAAIKALKGEQVDVVTSNPVLAADGVRDKKLFYDLLNLSAVTNNLDESYKSGPRECYKADVVYGSISNFQFDYLKDSFLGLFTRAGRPFESIILDEVDSMIIDNASHIAKLSEPMPGMDSLKYIYIKIWQELFKAEEKIIREFGEQLKAKAQELRKLSISDDEAQSLYTEFLDGLYGSITQRIKDFIKLSNPTKIDIIPSHIQKYADNSLDRWIDSALAAKFVYHEDEQYVIGVKNNEQVIQPVDYANTGMTLKNTIWQYGLHQFLQLKHNLHLTSENLTSCFISNLGYINKYGDKIYGLTGTLGSEAEQGLLSSIYNVDFAKIPTYKEKKFSEYDSKIIDDEIFSVEIADDVISKINNDRAVLIICETIKDAKAIRKELKNSKSEINPKTFFDEDNSHITEQEVNSGDVIIATNIAGRGTDFKTSNELESNKGLHVCVAFLPCNKRVEDQAFGRTARQGNHGSAQLIVKRSEIKQLGIDSDCVKKIKNVRDQKERARIQLIQDIKVPELEFQDHLFELFSALYRKLEKEFGYKREHKFVLDDLKEFWAFWLNNQNFEGSEIVNKSLENEFSNFKSEAQKVIKGEIAFNPYYSIQQAEFFISSNEKLDEAENSLNHAIRISKNPEILHGAYLKHFEIAIKRGRVFTDKCRKALGDCFFIPFVEPDRDYKQKAKGYLKLTKKAFKIELDYINKLVDEEEFSNILRNDTSSESSLEPAPNTAEQKENLFIKHIVSKQQALSLAINHSDSMVEQIDKFDGGLSVGCRIPDYIANMKPKNDNEKEIKKIIANSELIELAANGANITYALREMHDVSPEIALAAQIQIGGGIALFVTGVCFPPALPVTSSIAGTMITEGLCDVAIELLSANSKFDKEAYIKGKVISYGISLLTMGINAALQCPKILEKAKNACRWIAETLRKCPYLRRACEYVAANFDKLANWFEKMETLAKFQNMTKLEKLNYINDLKNANDLKQLKYLGDNVKQFQSLVQELREVGHLTELTHAQRIASSLTQLVISVAKNVTIRTVEHAIISKIITPVLTSAMSGLKPIVKKHVEISVRDNIDREKLKYTCFEEIENIMKGIRQAIDYTTVKDIFKNTTLGMAKQCGNWKIQLGALAFDLCSSWEEVYNHAKYLCIKINKKLKSDGESVNEDVDDLINKLIEQLSEEIYALIVSTTIKTCKDIYVVGVSSRANYKRDAAERARCLEIHENFKNGGQAGQEQITALSDEIKVPIHIHEENGNVIIIGEQLPGDPIKIRYFPPDESNPSGHYVPLGEDRNWSCDNTGNNCVFDAVGSQIGEDAETLRQNTAERIESDPARYIASHVRDVFGSDILLEGGRTNQPILEDCYPSGKLVIKVALKHTPVLANLRNSLNKHYKECKQFDSKGNSQKLRHIKRSKCTFQFGAIPDKEEMMMGTMHVTFTDGSQLKLVTISGDKPFFVKQSITGSADLSFTAEPIPFAWNCDGFEFVDPGKPTGNVFDVYKKQDTAVNYTTSCTAQKLIYHVGEYMKAHPKLEINGDIYMAESWYKPGDAKFSSDQVIINKSCSHCEQVLPVATGKRE